MQCENDLCIYWEENVCLLDNVSINALGQCSEQISVSFDKETLRQVRARMRRELGD